MIDDLINEEVRTRVELNIATSAEIEARKAHHEAMKALEKALIEEGGWHVGKEVTTTDGRKLRLNGIYLSTDAKQLRASCSSWLKSNKWSAYARDRIVLKRLESET